MEPGHFTMWIKSSLLIESIGIDTSKAMLKEAKIRWPQGPLLQGEATRLPFMDKSVDVVAFITSLEFIQDAVGALEEAARVAKIGINLGLMNKNSIGTLKKRFQAATLKDSFYRQAKFYSASDIEKMLENILAKKHNIAFCRTTVFPKPFSDKESSIFLFGGFLGIAIKIGDTP